MPTLLAVLICLLGATSKTAHAVDVAPVGGLNFYRPSQNPDLPVGTERKSKAALQAGVLVAWNLGETYEFETGILRSGRKTEVTSASQSVTSRYGTWMIPVTFRFMRAEFLGFGFGPYVAFLEKGDDPLRRGLEIGLRASLRGEIPVAATAKALLDLSYAFGFTDMNESTTAEDKNQEFSLLFGLRIPLETAHE
jgi:hypothetical protein